MQFLNLSRVPYSYVTTYLQMPYIMYIINLLDVASSTNHEYVFRFPNRRNFLYISIQLYFSGVVNKLLSEETRSGWHLFRYANYLKINLLVKLDP